MRFFQSFILVAGSIACFSIWQTVSKPSFSSGRLSAQNTYFGPSGTSENEQLVRVEINVKDSPSLGGVRVREVRFDGASIPLKNPPDIYGHRGSGSFQVYPGTYTLRWTVDKNERIWPRTVSHEEVVHVNPRDLWVQITIEGDLASIR